MLALTFLMVTVSHIVKKMVNSRPMLYEALANDIVNFANLAEQLKPAIEAEMGEKIKEAAIIMALRRYSETISSKETKKIPFKFNSEIVMKTGLADITIVKSPSALQSLRKIYELVDYNKGDTLNIIHGNYEITIIISEKLLHKVLELFKNEKVVNKEKELVSLTMSFSKEFLYTPGILAKATRKLAWENVNIYENISTMTEMIFLVQKKDAVKAYNTLQELIEEWSDLVFPHP